MNTQTLRRAIRNDRRQLSRQTLKIHSNLMARQANACHTLQHSRRIAFYFANDGEMDPKPLVERALRTGKHCYFPVLRCRPATSLWFAAYKKGQSLEPNRFGIPEPSGHHKQVTMPWGLDLIILPLVAFDRSGNRMGMGGGYYDRTLSFKTQRSHWKGPKLIGIAHDFQYVDSLTANPWDVPLDGVITEKKLYQFTRT
ncbi:MAG: 5-formyltetrahydrofolate cyclo-ligase [Gammaproteobacteria bacterium]|nr:5-formyltetrahydrofolate cyclo-ligase [Gammaproteobacteria bacterium]